MTDVKPSATTLVALLYRVTGGGDLPVIVEVTGRADRRARAIREGLQPPCPDCAAQVVQTWLGAVEAIAIEHSPTCPYWLKFLSTQPGRGAA